jgi:hypothetical protein
LPRLHIVSLLAQVLLGQHGDPAKPQIAQYPDAQVLLETVHSLLAQQTWFKLPQAKSVPVPVAMLVMVAVALPVARLVFMPVFMPVFMSVLPTLPPASLGAATAASGSPGKSPFFQHLPLLQMYPLGQALVGSSEHAISPLIGWGLYLHDRTRARPNPRQAAKLRFAVVIRIPPWRKHPPCPDRARELS